MDFEDIVSKAADKALSAAVDNSTPSNFPQLEESLQRDVDLYRPIRKYVDALVAESLRIYHEQVSTRRDLADKQ